MYKRLILTFVLCLSLTALAQATGPIAYYPFDGDIDDYSGNSKDGVFWSNGATATPTFVSGKSFQAISLQAYDSYNTAGVGGTKIYECVILPDESYFDTLDNISIAAWVKYNSVMAVANQGNYAAIVCRGNNLQYQMSSNWYSASGYSRFYWKVVGSGWNNSTFSVLPGTTNDPTAITDFDEWYHVVVTYSSAEGTANIYVNGELNISQTKTTILTPLSDTDAAVAIGARAKSDYTPEALGTSTDGLIDEVAIWDRVLTSAQVAYIYNNGVPEPATLALLGLGSLSLLYRRRKG